MRHKVGASGAAGFLAAAAVIASGLFWAAGGFAPAFAYSGSQAEAQSDPVADPYGFPNIKLCCEPKKKKHRKKRRPHDYPDYDYPDDDGDGDRKVVRVSCGEPRRHSYSSVEEALEKLSEGGIVRVWPGAACDISGLKIDQGVTIESEDRDGGRAALYASRCVTVALGYGNSVAAFRGIDVNACVVLERGRLNFDQVNLSWRRDEDAIRLKGGAFTATSSTVLARGSAINASNGASVSLTGGAFASAFGANQVLLLDVGKAILQNTTIKGARAGIRLLGRYPVVLTDVRIIRGEGRELRRAGRGEVGIVVGGLSEGDDFPSLPNAPGASFTIERGQIAGFESGLVFASGSIGSARGLEVSGARYGIVVEDEADVELTGNKILGSERVGIDLKEGALGSAVSNSVVCADGRCVCYGGECTSRSDRDFGKGAFRMSGTRCDD